MTDRGYANLLAHLHNASPTLPVATIQSALVHYLAHLVPLPTPLAATAVSSALYLAQPFALDRLQSLLTAFRHAVHFKYRVLVEDGKARSRIGNLFSKSLTAALGQWVDDVVKGVQGGHPVLRLSSLSGLLLGIHDLELEAKNPANSTHPLAHSIPLGSARDPIEDELIVAVAEVMDTYSYGLLSGSSGEWEKEFHPAGQDVLTLALAIASQSLLLVSQSRFSVLPLPTLTHLVVITLSSTFQAGKFLHELPSSVTRQGEHRVHLPASSPVAKSLHSVTSSPVINFAASLSRLAANGLRSLLEDYSDRRIADGLRSASQTLQTLRDIATQVELDWNSGSLADVPEHDMAPETRPVAQTIWTILKTLLFSTIMLSDAVLASIVYIQPGSTPYTETSLTPPQLALQVLHILSHYAFIISQFGGVTSTSQGFEQLKKTFYLALDILAQTDGGTNAAQNESSLANIYVKDQCLSLKSSAFTRAPISIQNAKKALVLASIEQLIPVLNEESIREYAFDVCWPHLSDPSHRETFESAHSVILAIFASHAQKQQQQQQLRQSGNPANTTKSSNKNHVSPAQGANDANSDFVKKMVPFYAHCLIENSADGRLSTPQLRMAYSALVRCAGASGLNVDAVPEETLSLAWYCVQLLLDTIHTNTPSGDVTSKGKEKARVESTDNEHLQRLRLTLISTVPSLPLVLMLQVLEEIKDIVISLPPSAPSPTAPSSSTPRGTTNSAAPGEEGTRTTLVKALYDEVLERVGYKEKSSVMRWWYQNRMELGHGPDQVVDREGGRVGT